MSWCSGLPWDIQAVSCPLGSLVLSPRASLGLLQGHCTSRQSPWAGGVGKGAVLEPSCHGDALGLFRAVLARKQSPWGFLGSVWSGSAQQGWLCYLRLMESPARVICRVCVRAGRVRWGSSASRAALQSSPKSRDLHAVCLPTSPVLLLLHLQLGSPKLQAGNSPTQCSAAISSVPWAAAAAETMGMAQGEGFDLKKHPRAFACCAAGGNPSWEGLLSPGGAQGGAGVPRGTPG